MPCMTGVACVGMAGAMARMIIMACVGILVIVGTMTAMTAMTGVAAVRPMAMPVPMSMPVGTFFPCFHKEHPAFGAGAGLITDHFGVHGAGILRRALSLCSMV